MAELVIPLSILHTISIFLLENNTNGGQEEHQCANPSISPLYRVSIDLTVDLSSQTANIYQKSVQKFKFISQASSPNCIWRIFEINAKNHGKEISQGSREVYSEHVKPGWRPQLDMQFESEDAAKTSLMLIQGL